MTCKFILFSPWLLKSPAYKSDRSGGSLLQTVSNLEELLG